MKFYKLFKIGTKKRSEFISSLRFINLFLMLALWLSHNHPKATLANTRVINIGHTKRMY